MAKELTRDEEQATRAITNHERWATCEHLSAAARDHRCPDCRGTLRRCCDSLVGYYGHAESCQSHSRHQAEGVA